MHKNITKAELKASLPHGMLKKIAKKAGVSNAAVSRFFSDETKSSHRIYKAALEVAIELKLELTPLELEFKD